MLDCFWAESDKLQIVENRENRGSLMSGLGDVQHRYLGNLIASAGKTMLGLTDMRSYDWSGAPHDRKVRPTYYEDHILRVDFSNSKAEQGFRVRRAVFEECVFDRSVWWRMTFSKCRFVKCSFNGCRLYNSSFGDEFHDCSFKKLTTKGERFSFGWGSKYNRCNFESVDIRNITDMVGVRFEDCTISGTLTNGIFRGRRYALKQRLYSLPDLLFSTYYRPVAFIRCDLSGLKTENVVFEKDIIFQENQIGERSFFGNH